MNNATAGAGEEMIVLKKKTGRKAGYRMPSWNKALLASRRDCISLESVNIVLSRIGEALTESGKCDSSRPESEARFILTMPSGKKKSLLLVSSNLRNLPNQRNFLFKDLEINARVSFVTQEIYEGIISGVLTPVTPCVREKLYGILVTSSEIQAHIKERAMRTKASQPDNASLEATFDDGAISLHSKDTVDSDLLSELERRSAEQNPEQNPDGKDKE